MWSYESTQRLASAIPGLSARCLKTASLFASEQLLGVTLPPDDTQADVSVSSEDPTISFARGLLEAGSYNRCVHILDPKFEEGSLREVGLFLHQYAKYLGKPGEERSDEPFEHPQGDPSNTPWDPSNTRRGKYRANCE